MLIIVGVGSTKATFGGVNSLEIQLIYRGGYFKEMEWGGEVGRWSKLSTRWGGFCGGGGSDADYHACWSDDHVRRGTMTMGR